MIDFHNARKVLGLLSMKDLEAAKAQQGCLSQMSFVSLWMKPTPS